jgi:hypothetical protein
MVPVIRTYPDAASACSGKRPLAVLFRHITYKIPICTLKIDLGEQVFFHGDETFLDLNW